MPHQGYANINTGARSLRAAVLGFTFTDSTDDIVVSEGLIDQVAFAGATLDVSVLSLGDGTHAIIHDGTDVTAQLAATALLAGEVKLGEFVEASAIATSWTYEDRGLASSVSLVSADEATPAA
jgi:hypothetical protein